MLSTRATKSSAGSLHHDVGPAIALGNGRHDAAAHRRLDQLLHLGDADPEPRHALPVHLDVEVAETLHRLDLDVDRSVDRFESRGDASPSAVEPARQISSPKILTAIWDLTPRRARRRASGSAACSRARHRGTRRASRAGPPSEPAPWFVRSSTRSAAPARRRCRSRDAHRVRGDVRAAVAADDLDDLRQLLNRLLEARDSRDALGERDRRQLEGLHDDRALVHRRHELGAERRHQQRAPRRPAARRPTRISDRGCARAQRSCGSIGGAEQLGRGPASVPREDSPGAQQQEASTGTTVSVRSSEQAESDRDRVGERREHLALHALERGDRQEDDDDHRDMPKTIGRRTSALAARTNARRSPSSRARRSAARRSRPARSRRPPACRSAMASPGERHEVGGQADPASIARRSPAPPAEAGSHDEQGGARPCP